MRCRAKPAAFLVVAAISTAFAAPDSPNPLREQFLVLKREYQSSVSAAIEAARKAESKEEQIRLHGVLQDLHKRFPKRLFDLANDRIADPVAAEILSYLVANFDSTPEAEQATELLIRRHPRSEHLVPACQWLARGSCDAAEAWLRVVLGGNPHRAVRGEACLGLAQVLKRKIDANPQSEDELTTELRQLLGRTANEFGDVPHGKGTLADAAKAELRSLTVIAIGNEAPEISGTDIDGKQLKLSDYRGKVVLLKFWGLWCPPCRSMLPIEQAFVARFKDKPFAMLAVNTDRENLEELKKRFAAEKITWPNWRDSGGGPICRAWKIRAFPSTFLIDHNGVIREKWLGNQGEKIFGDAIDRLLKEAEDAQGKNDPK